MECFLLLVKVKNKLWITQIFDIKIDILQIWHI